MLNPSGYKQDWSIAYDSGGHDKKPGVMGLTQAQPRYTRTKPQDINFDIVLDNTGVVPNSSDVATQITALKALVYDYVGTNHEPNVVKLVWGNFSFTGRLTKMSVQYTLFKPTGDPLRAKVNIAFTDYTSAAQEASEAGKSSPDLSHLVEVKAGDSLPLLCFRIYNDDAYYLEVAKANGITNFRNIKPGTMLNFPPLR
jgi:Contractile injection system tube protein